MEVRPACVQDIVSYAALGRAAQAWLLARGLNQYVPAAHEEYAPAIRTRVELGTLFAVQDGDETVGFFSLDTSPSAWWPADQTPALYLSGMVVARSAHHRGIGGFIIDWCVAQAAQLDRQYVRLDCHAGNPWLCRYYEAHGFKLQGRCEQHPGYFGCLYQRSVTTTHVDPQHRPR
jgi:GNAT superfamily N-acetyltransferase